MINDTYIYSAGLRLAHSQLQRGVPILIIRLHLHNFAGVQVQNGDWDTHSPCVPDSQHTHLHRQGARASSLSQLQKTRK
jgi:hypothetical protein